MCTLCRFQNISLIIAGIKELVHNQVTIPGISLKIMGTMDLVKNSIITLYYFTFLVISPTSDIDKISILVKIIDFCNFFEFDEKCLSFSKEIPLSNGFFRRGSNPIRSTSPLLFPSKHRGWRFSMGGDRLRNSSGIPIFLFENFRSDASSKKQWLGFQLKTFSEKAMGSFVRKSLILAPSSLVELCHPIYIACD